MPPVILGGTGYVDGQPAPAGAWIVALHDGKELARIKVREEGRFGPMEIPRPPAGGPISFTVADKPADLQLRWRSGSRLLQDLRAGAGVVPATLPPAQPAATATPIPTATPQRENTPTPTPVVLAGHPLRPGEHVPEGPEGEEGPGGAAWNPTTITMLFMPWAWPVSPPCWVLPG